LCFVSSAAENALEERLPGGHNGVVDGACHGAKNH
jgi:hypothetical protein